MRIVILETWVCARDDRFFDAKRSGRGAMPWDVVVLRLTADNGLQGHACCLGARSGALSAAYLHDVVAPVVLGRDATDREAVWHDLWNVDRHLTFFPVYLPGPVDVALWDIAAQAAGLPLFRCIGACRTSLPVYASSLFLPDVDAYVKEMEQYRKRGIPAYKAHPPGPWRTDMEVHRALRAAAGPDYTLMTDPVAEYSLDEAIRVGRDLEKLDYLWFEEPFRDFELEKYARLCAALDIPICATETTRGAHWGVAQAIVQRAVDIVRADVSWKCGVTGTLKICHLAEAFGMRCEIHTTTIGFMDVVNLHVSCAVRNCEWFEMFVPDDKFQFPMKTPFAIDRNGWIHVPDEKPGIGVELDWDAIDRQCTAHREQSA
jgi:L-alanine-DL-glutamate epimerase-like enolase superfamily enzyme